MGREHGATGCGGGPRKGTASGGVGCKVLIESSPMFGFEVSDASEESWLSLDAY